MTLEQQSKNYNVKDGYIIQTKMFNWAVVMSIDSKEREMNEKLFGDHDIPLCEHGVRSGKFVKRFSSSEQEILFYLNKFALYVDVLDIQLVSKIRSNYHGGTFSKTSETSSATPAFLLIYQISKEKALHSYPSVEDEKK